MKPTYYKALWHNCNRCRIHYMSDDPQLRAYLCDDCWGSIPHYHVKNVQKKVIPKSNDIELGTIILYTIGNLLCLGVIAYYLWFR